MCVYSMIQKEEGERFEIYTRKCMPCALPGAYHPPRLWLILYMQQTMLLYGRNRIVYIVVYRSMIETRESFETVQYVGVASSDKYKCTYMQQIIPN